MLWELTMLWFLMVAAAVVAVVQEILERVGGCHG